MRIIDKQNDRVLTSILILLTPEEAHFLADRLESLDPESGDHVHVNDRNYLREATFVIYTPTNLKFLVESVRQIIEEEDD